MIGGIQRFRIYHFHIVTKAKFERILNIASISCQRSIRAAYKVSISVALQMLLAVGHDIKNELKLKESSSNIRRLYIIHSAIVFIAKHIFLLQAVRSTDDVSDIQSRKGVLSSSGISICHARAKHNFDRVKYLNKAVYSSSVLIALIPQQALHTSKQNSLLWLLKFSTHRVRQGITTTSNMTGKNHFDCREWRFLHWLIVWRHQRI